jgi:phage terminase small subunit
MATDKLTAKQALDNLTPQRRKFVLSYCDTFNATKAALAAGYSKKTARTYGSQLLTFLDIKTAVKAVLATASMDPEEIAARWTALARAGLSDFYTVEEYEVGTEVEQSLVNAIAGIEEELAYEYEYMTRKWGVLGTDEEQRGKDLLEHEKHVKYRRLDILRHQMQLERNPAAVRIIAGPKVKKQRVVLDLVKAESLGMLDLIKGIVPTEYGTKVELRSPDAALENLAKWQNMLTTKIDLTSKGESVAPPPIVGMLSAETARAILEARRLAREKGAAAGE